MPLTFEQETFLWELQEAEPGSQEEKNALQFIAENDINFEDEELFCWTPLITAIQYKRDKIIDALLAKGADIYHVGQQGTTALATAIAVQDSRMIAFLHAKYKTRWPQGEDRILVEEVVGLMDEYYPTDKVKTNSRIRDYRATKVPKLNAYRTQPTPWSRADIAFLQKQKEAYQALLQERDLDDFKREQVAKLIADEAKRKEFVEKDVALRKMELEAYNQAQRERDSLEQKLKEEQAKRKELEAKQKQYEEAHHKVKAEHQVLVSRQAQVEAEVVSVAQEVKSVGAKMGSLWQAHEAVLDMKAEQVFIRGQGALRVFYGQVQSKLNDLFVGRSAARSGELVVQDGGAGRVSSAINLAGDLLPFPGSKLVVGIVAAAAGFYVKYRKGQRDQRVDQGLSGVASGVVEWETHISEPSARSLTLLGDQQIRQFGEQEARQLGEIAVRLMLVWITVEYPQQSPPPDYEEIIHHLLLAVRLQRAGKLQDIHGKTIKPKLLVTTSGERLAEDKIFAAFSEQRPRIEHPAPKSGPPLDPLPKAPAPRGVSIPIASPTPSVGRSVSPTPPPFPRVVGISSPVPAAALLAPGQGSVSTPLVLSRVQDPALASQQPKPFNLSLTPLVLME